MFEMFVLMLAVAIQSAPASQSGADAVAFASVASPTQSAPQPETAAPADTTAQAEAAPAFLAPAPAPETAPPPVFLAPAAPALVAEPQVPTGRFTTALEVRPILDVTRGNWIAVREFDGQDLLYVTHLWSWRCGLVALSVGINGAPPEPWPLPPCHMDQQTPNAIMPDDGDPFRRFPLGSIATVEVVLTYDDLSTDSGRYDRRGMPIP